MMHNTEQNTAIESKIPAELCCGSCVISPPISDDNTLWDRKFKRAANSFFLAQEFSIKASQESLRLFSTLLLRHMGCNIGL